MSIISAYNTMSLRILLLIALLASVLLVGCSNPQKQIVGTWTFSDLEFGDDMANNPMGRGIMAGAIESARGTTMTFNDDGTFNGQAGAVTSSGTYTLTERNIQINYDNLGDLGRFRGTLSDDGKTLSVEIPNMPGTNIVYVKQ